MLKSLMLRFGTKALPDRTRDISEALRLLGNWMDDHRDVLYRRGHGNTPRYAMQVAEVRNLPPTLEGLQEAIRIADNMWTNSANAFNCTPGFEYDRALGRAIQLEEVLSTFNRVSPDMLSAFISNLIERRREGVVDHADLLIMADWLDEQDAVELARQLRDPNLNVENAVRRLVGS